MDFRGFIATLITFFASAWIFNSVNFNVEQSLLLAFVFTLLWTELNGKIEESERRIDNLEEKHNN